MYIFLLLLFSLCSSEVISAAVNTTSNQFQILKDKDQITSGDGNFKLGFFSPPDSTNRYVGIWYNADYKSLEVVWVANRENPVKGSDGVLKLSKDGNLQVLDRQNKVYWSSNTSQSGSSNSWVAEFQAGGNLVLVSTTGGNVIWQSFTHPTNSLLSSMKIGVYDIKNINNNTSTQTNQVLQSWKSPSDPSRGRFTLGIAPSTTYDVYVWDDNGKPYWRTGPWNGNSFLGVPATYYSGMINTFTVDPDGSDQWLKYVPQQTAVLDHYVLDSDGNVLHKVQRENQVIWRSIESDCDVYGKCGPFGKCNSTDSPICSCLDGFEPTNEKEWKRGNWTSGCSRRTPLRCDNERENTDGFLRVPNVKIPAQGKSTYTTNQEECRKMCLEQCSCLAYAYYVGIGCMNWNQSLIDTQEFNVTAVDLFIRLAQSEIAALTDKNTTTPQPHNKNSKWKTIVVVCLITGAIILAFIGFYVWRKTNRRKEWKYSKRKDSLPYSNTNSSELDFISAEFKDLPLFKLETLAVATRDFHLSNKLGEGGFGPVFKGKLEDGQEIAVKRLARASGQGLQEFMNEVLLISKLQHRNLVRLLGCCIQGEEKLLVYEYMPNKSLDALLFDPTHRQLLDWKTRFNIIKGILRGLLYLHRDSRLRIIHRDLKASNILLDEELNPKISDFGMAKIFEAKEDQGKTSRIVGTYGYMSPEYAMEGNFSEKSDVYSFGVLLLEIVSGRRNRSFKEEDESSGLIGYVWKLWNDGNALSLIDPIISEACFQEEIFKCIYIGLLCVQEFPEDRPTISTIISMLDNETSELPRVTQPGITQRRSFLLPTDTPHTGQQWSVNNISVTLPIGR